MTKTASAIVVDLMVAQRKRMTAAIFDYMETQSWYKTLSPAQRRELRDVFFSNVNTFTDFCRDVIRVSDQDERDEGAVAALGQVLASQHRLERHVEQLLSERIDA